MWKKRRRRQTIKFLLLISQTILPFLFLYSTIKRKAGTPRRRAVRPRSNSSHPSSSSSPYPCFSSNQPGSLSCSPSPLLVFPSSLILLFYILFHWIPLSIFSICSLLLFSLKTAILSFPCFWLWWIFSSNFVHLVLGLSSISIPTPTPTTLIFRDRFKVDFFIYIFCLGNLSWYTSCTRYYLELV